MKINPEVRKKLDSDTKEVRDLVKELDQIKRVVTFVERKLFDEARNTSDKNLYKLVRKIKKIRKQL